MPEMSWSALDAHLIPHCDGSLLSATRVHRLAAFDTAQAEVWVKREDESGFGISGTKRRKYASLLPALRAGGYTDVALLGGARSNHVVSLLQLLREAGLRPHLFLKASHSPDRGGNRLLLDLLAAPEDIHWVPAAQWPQAGAQAARFLASLDRPGCLIPEGGHHPFSLAGAMTLAPAIGADEGQTGPFDHIFIDAGTGLSASALRAGLHLMGHRGTLHVVLIAGHPDSFAAQDAQVSAWAGDLFPAPFPPPERLQVHEPLTARAFGSVNATILAGTRRLARDCGILTDPIYTTKLFLTAEAVIRDQGLRGRVLIIHSGGGTGLLGFGDRLQALSGF